MGQHRCACGSPTDWHASPRMPAVPCPRHSHTHAGPRWASSSLSRREGAAGSHGGPLGHLRIPSPPRPAGTPAGDRAHRAQSRRLRVRFAFACHALVLRCSGSPGEGPALPPSTDQERPPNALCPSRVTVLPWALAGVSSAPQRGGGGVNRG